MYCIIAQKLAVILHSYSTTFTDTAHFQFIENVNGILYFCYCTLKSGYPSLPVYVQVYLLKAFNSFNKVHCFGTMLILITMANAKGSIFSKGSANAKGSMLFMLSKLK